MIRFRQLRELNLHTPTAPQARAHLSAASGLVVRDPFLYVVADDEHYLGMFTTRHDEPGHLIRLLPGDLPTAHKDRKAAKPDLETLCLLPAFDGYPDGALLALGSGSRPKRERGLLLALAPDGTARGDAAVVDLTPLYAVLRAEFPRLNIEGAIVVNDALWLLQRGARDGVGNACIVLRLDPVLTSLAAQRRIDAGASLRSRHIALGTCSGIALGFTDGTALPDGRVLFSAVAENTGNAYDDGACAGSAIGLLDGDAGLRWIETVDGNPKIEGIAARIVDRRIHLLCVTDADDATLAARLLAAEIADPQLGA